MPKVKRKFDTNTAPPIDWLWACVLERQKVYGYDLRDMAMIAGVEYGNMRCMWRRSPWAWKREPRERVCRHFGINLNFVPVANDGIEVRIG